MGGRDRGGRYEDGAKSSSPTSTTTISSSASAASLHPAASGGLPQGRGPRTRRRADHADLRRQPDPACPALVRYRVGGPHLHHRDRQAAELLQLAVSIVEAAIAKTRLWDGCDVRVPPRSKHDNRSKPIAFRQNTEHELPNPEPTLTTADVPSALGWASVDCQPRHRGTAGVEVRIQGAGGIRGARR